MKLKQIPVKNEKGQSMKIGDLSKNQLIKMIVRQKQDYDYLFKVAKMQSMSIIILKKNSEYFKKLARQRDIPIEELEEK